jgi:hypothetical protein
MNEWEVQQAQNYRDVHIPEGEWFCLTEKINGVRGTVFDGKVISRQGREFTGLDHILDDLKRLVYPNNLSDYRLIKHKICLPDDGSTLSEYVNDAIYYNLETEVFLKYSLVVMEGAILDMVNVYTDLEKHIDARQYDVRAMGYDPYNAKEFVQTWVASNGPYNIEKVIQGAKTETVPLGEIKILAEQNALIFDELIMQFCMGNTVTLEDTNGNRKLSKMRNEQKIDAVSVILSTPVDTFSSNQMRC